MNESSLEFAAQQQRRNKVAAEITFTPQRGEYELRISKLEAKVRERDAEIARLRNVTMQDIAAALAAPCPCAELREQRDRWKACCDGLEEAVRALAKYLGCEPDEVERTFDKLRAELAAANERAWSAECDFGQAKQDLADAVEALRIIQWGDSVLDADGETVHQLCPRCDQVEKNGHSPDCEVGATVARFGAAQGVTRE